MKNRTLANLSKLPPDALEAVKRVPSPGLARVPEFPWREAHPTLPARAEGNS
ncbi:MAG: hypothetical protein RIT81_34450 [Deltaproteobacteria bacterium]